jgi:hypothetical protein
LADLAVAAVQASLASHGLQRSWAELKRGYGITEFRDDLKSLYRTAGIDGTPVVFLFNDTQIVTESFLEDINNMLNSGEVPGMFTQDDKDRVVNDVRCPTTLWLALVAVCRRCL